MDTKDPAVTPTVRLSARERHRFRLIAVEGGGVRVLGVLSWRGRRDGRRSVVVRVAECVRSDVEVPAWGRWLPYRSAQNRRDAIRAMRREGLRLWREAMEQMKKPAKEE